MKSTETRLDQFGRIVLPKGTREELGLSAGARLEIRVAGGEIRLREIESSQVARRGSVLVVTAPADGDLRDSVRQSRAARDQTVGGRGSRPR